MSWLTIIIMSLALAFFGALLWLLRPRRRASRAGQSPMGLKMESFLPRHYRYFPQVRQALSSFDEEYLDRVAPRDVAHSAHQERRAVARQFLAGLREDLSNLGRLARIVAARKDPESTRLDSSHLRISYAVICVHHED